MTVMIHVNNKNTNNHTNKMNNDNLQMDKFSCSFNVFEYKNLMLDQDNNLNLISLNILITCLLNNVWISQEEDSQRPSLGVKGSQIPLPLRTIFKRNNNYEKIRKTISLGNKFNLNVHRVTHVDFFHGLRNILGSKKNTQLKKHWISRKARTYGIM